MSLRTMTQFQHERDGWKRMLDFMQGENVYLKNRLAEVLNDPVDSQLLQMSENFQNNFLSADDLFCLLRSDIAEFDKLLVKQLFSDEPIPGIAVRKYRNIGKYMGLAERKFNRWKLEFNNYVFKNCMQS